MKALPLAWAIASLATLATLATPAHGDEPPPRAARRFAWSAGIEALPIPLVTVGAAVNVTPRLAVGAWGTYLVLAARVEIDAKVYLLTSGYSPYVYVGASAAETSGPNDEGEVQGYRAGVVFGAGFEAVSRSGYVFDVHVCAYSIEDGSDDDDLLGPGGGIAIGARW